MIMELSKLIYLLFLISRLWGRMDGIYYVDKSAVNAWADRLNRAFVENGMTERARSVIITFYNMPTMVLGASNCNGWIALNSAWQYENFVLYGKPLWVDTIAHELAHHYQGFGCGSEIGSVESEAEAMGWEALASLDDDEAKGALLYALRDTLRVMVMVRLAEKGGDASVILSATLPDDKERGAFAKSFEWCTTNLSKCKEYSRRYAEGAFKKALSDRRMDNFRRFWKSLLGDFCFQKYCPL